MDFPVFVDGQFVNASLLNAAMNALTTDFEAIGKELHTPGLLSPTSLVFTPSSLVIGIAAPDPFGVMFGSGIVTGAHGIVDGADTTSYSVNMAALRPVSGTRTAYIVAAYDAIGENLTTVVGPPSGHPDYNPNFNPFEFYTTQRASMAITGTTTAPDNITTFELCRVALSAGQSVILPNQIDTSHWHYASSVLDPTGVAAGTYTGATVTVDADGRITAASAVPYGPLAGTNTWTGANTFSQEATALAFSANGLDAGGGGGQFRATSSGYGVMLRNDGTQAYLLQTAQGQPNGGFTSLRPFSWNLVNGTVTVDGTGAGTTFGGAISVNDTGSAGVTVSGNANIRLTNNGANKFIRCFQNAFQVMNSVYGASILSLDDGGSLSINGNFSLLGSVNANGSITSGGALVSNSGNVTALNGRLLATFGARGSGNGNAGVILSDFFYNIQTLDEGQLLLPNNAMIQFFPVTAPVAAGLTSTLFSIPSPYQSGCHFAMIGYLGNTPPNDIGIAIQPQNASQVLVTTHGNAVTSVGCVVLVIGD